MTIQRLPITTSLDISAMTALQPGNSSIFAGQTTGPLNAFYATDTEDRVYAQQRPGIVKRDDTQTRRGRGIVFWDKAEDIYFVNDDTVYLGAYSNPLANTISGGKDPIYFIEVSEKLLIMDPENNEGWYIDLATPTVVTAIIDADFPPNFVTPKQLAGGGVQLDGYAFILTTDGTIYNSNLNDGSAWGGLDFIEASRENDKGVFLAKHHDNVVAIGSSSTEFFFDAGNPVGSPLERRSDIYYNTGATDRKHVHNTGDNILFIGAESRGTIGVFGISQFKLSKVSTDSIDFYINNILSVNKMDFIVTGATVNSHTLFFFTAVDPDEPTVSQLYFPITTIVFDTIMSTWSIFETLLEDGNKYGRQFPMIGVSTRGDDSGVARDEPVMISMHGDLFIFNTGDDIEDFISIGGYFEQDDYVEDQDDYVEEFNNSSNQSVHFRLRFDEVDLGVLTDKFASRLAVIGSSQSFDGNPSDVQVLWSDDSWVTRTPGRALSTTFRNSLPRLGKFQRRAHQIDYFGRDRLRIEAIELDIRASQYSQR